MLVLTVCMFTISISITNAINALPVLCGQRNSTVKVSLSDLRIVGGKESAPDEWPWQAYIRRVVLIGNVEFDIGFCSGTIIHDNWILTAAHCYHTDRNVLSYIVHLGIHDTNQLNGSATVKSALEKIIIHDEWNFDSKRNDIALIKIKEKLDFINKHKHLQPICLSSTVNEPRTRCFTTGWGDLNQDNKHTTVLMKVNEPIFDIFKCEIVFPNISKEQTICAGGTSDGGFGTCRGDSGGPLQCESDADSKWYQIGITSSGNPCALPNTPDVFTRVASYKDWIEKTIQNN